MDDDFNTAQALSMFDLAGPSIRPPTPGRISRARKTLKELAGNVGIGLVSIQSITATAQGLCFPREAILLELKWR
jgi:hypothetical protein